jgi:hydrogenase-4 component B
MTLALILCGVAAIALSGVPGFLMDHRGKAGQTLATLIMVLGSAMGMSGAVWTLVGGDVLTREGPWFLPWGMSALRLDPLAAFFLVPIFLVPALGSIYGQEYWKQSEHPENGRKLRFFYGLLAASMGLVALARDGFFFLIAWEIMALSAYFLATTEDDDPAACRSGWIYLVATHLGTICLISLFAFIRRTTGSTSLVPIAESQVTSGAITTIFVLTVLGFGFKAGLMPLHVWLPGAHANAPSHVSAVLSGVMLKMGIYGIIRITGLLPRLEPWHGATLLAAGAVSAVLGVALALGQSDLKRVLAYSSIENIGIIAMGLGLALLGKSVDRREWIALGLAGALLHVWNHSLFKSLLFFNAGAIIHATHTREFHQLGGLARLMPRAAVLFLVGAGAICALPGLNGFVSEWLIYSGLFRTLGTPSDPFGATWPFAALGAPVLAVVGALAVACFVSVFGSTFLGAARTDSGAHAHDPGKLMQTSMLVLALGCAAVGLVPKPVLFLLERVVSGWGTGSPARSPALGDLAPVGWISVFGAGLLALALLLAVFYLLSRRRGPVGASVTWDCGYAGPTARMQYTPSSFTAFVAGLFQWSLWPKTHRPQISGLFPKAAAFKAFQPDPLLDRGILPVVSRTAKLFLRLRLLQQGQIQIYMLYSLAILILLFWWGRNGR